MIHYSLYTDGACSGNPGRGGWAAVAFNDEGDNIMQYSGGYRLTTNNRMEIRAVAEGLNYLVNQICGKGSKDTDIKVTVYSDSQLVIGTMNNGWAKKTNTDLWSDLDAIIHHTKSIKGWNFEFEFIKVKGHADNANNNFVDMIAVELSRPENAKGIDTYYEAIAKESGLFNESTVIKEISLTGCDTTDKREVHVKLSNGTTVTILPKSGGFIQTDCTRDESQITLPVAWKFNSWLNGKPL